MVTAEYLEIGDLLTHVSNDSVVFSVYGITRLKRLVHVERVTSEGTIRETFREGSLNRYEPKPDVLQPSPLVQKPNEQSIASAYEYIERTEYASRDDA